jgi:hypothetical protein
MTVQVATSNKLIYFQDDTSMRLALWITQEMKAYYPDVNIDSAVVCNQLSIGLRNNECLLKLIDLKMEGIKKVDRPTKLSVEKAAPDRVRLMVVFDPEQVV